MEYPKATGRVTTTDTGAVSICRLSSAFLGEKNENGLATIPDGIYYVSGTWIAKSLVDVEGTPTLYYIGSSFRTLVVYNSGNVSLPIVDEGLDQSTVFNGFPPSPATAPTPTVVSSTNGIELFANSPTSDSTDWIGSLKLELKLPL